MLLLLVAWPAVTRPDVDSGSPGVRAVGDRTHRAITIDGLDPEVLRGLDRDQPTVDRWSSLCGVTIPTDRQATRLPGNYRVQNSSLRITTRHPLDQRSYRVLVDPSLLCDTDRRRAMKDHPGRPLAVDVEIETSAPHSLPSPTEITAVHPSALELPENLLRFYLHFSAPMSRGKAYKHIHLRESSGRLLEDAFLELDEELWSTDGRRFTLLFDPGRIKRGLKPREELGPVLEQGKRYLLVIDRDWPDAEGNPLGHEFRMPIQVGPPDGQSPKPRAWTIHSPQAGTKEPVTVDFHEALDNALARRLIVVKDKGGKTLEGMVSLDDDDTRWTWRPRSPWQSGEYQLVVGTDLEDLAGNSIGRPFEVDVVGPISAQVESQTVVLPFRVAATGR